MSITLALRHFLLDIVYKLSITKFYDALCIIDDGRLHYGPACCRGRRASLTFSSAQKTHKRQVNNT